MEEVQEEKRSSNGGSKRKWTEDSLVLSTYPELILPKAVSAGGYSHANKKHCGSTIAASSSAYPLRDLKNGLEFVLKGQFSQEIAFHAKKLLDALYGAGGPAAAVKHEKTPRKKFNNAAADDAVTLHYSDGEDGHGTAANQVVKHEGSCGENDSHAAINQDSRTDGPAAHPDENPMVATKDGGADCTNGHNAAVEENSYIDGSATNKVTEHIAEDKHTAGTGLDPTAPFGTETGTQTLPPLPPVHDVALLAASFTHSSCLPSHVPPTNLNCYENLEFLGDAYLEIIATRLIHRSFSNFTVGQWSQLRERLVCNNHLAQLSRAYGFDQRLLSTEQERHSGSFTKILADVFEAYLAAIILADPVHGFTTAETWMYQLFQPGIAEWYEKCITMRHLEPRPQDAKQDLQKLIGFRSAKIEYLEERPMIYNKLGNMQTFFIGVFYTGFNYVHCRLGGGQGRNKTSAGLAAAKDALENNMNLLKEINMKKLRATQPKTTNSGKVVKRHSYLHG